MHLSPTSKLGYLSFKKAFRSLGYDENMVNEQTDEALRITKNDLLKYQHKENVDRIPFVVTYHHNIL